MNKPLLICLIFLSNALLLNAQIKQEIDEFFNCRLIEIDALYPGGELSWQQYLNRNFREKEVRCQMPLVDTVYTQTVVIIFKIFKDGRVGEAFCRNAASINVALKNEAVRLIKDSPKWIPAMRNGRVVNAYRVEKISITISPLYL